MAEINDLNVTDASNTARQPEGMAASAVNDGVRALEGMLARHHKDNNGSLVSTGAANVFALAANQTISAYYDGLTFTFEAATANTAAATMNVDAVGAQAIVWPNGTALSSGDIPAEAKVTIRYDLGNTRWLLCTLSVPPRVIVQGADIASASPLVLGTDGGYFDVTGTTGFSSITAVAGTGQFVLQFDGTLTMTDGASLDLGGGNITTAAGDRATFFVTAANTVEMLSYQREGVEPLGSGRIIQVVNTQDGAVATGTTSLPFDDTAAPQITEGDEFMTLAITPKAAANTLVIQVQAVVAHSVAQVVTMALFQDSTANALAAVGARGEGSDQMHIITLTHKMPAGTTSSTTFRIRINGATGATQTFNGVAAGRIYAGVAASSITITEVAA